MSKRSGVLSDHRRIGKKFYPPAARIGWTEIHYVERIIPEIAWIAYFVKKLGVAEGTAHSISFIEAGHSSRCPENLELTLCSNYRQLRSEDWVAIRKRLQAKDIFLRCLDCLVPFMRCFPLDNPMAGLAADATAVPASSADVQIAREIVAELFDRRCKIASIIQSVVSQAGFVLGTHHVPEGYPYSNFETLIQNFESQHAQAVASHVRMHVNFVFGRWEPEMRDTWARYFWNRGRELVPLDANNHRDLPPPDANLHPAFRLGLDYERYAWTVVDHIWERLPVDTYDSELYEVLGALLARQCNLSVKLFKNIELWDYHAGPLFLRPMTDCIITTAWILKSPLERARQFISYGLGQEKLAIERLRHAAAKSQGREKQDLEEVIQARTAWVDGQHYAFLQTVDVGSWSGMSTRKMAEEADRSELYDFAYTGWSHAAHGTWNHIGIYEVWPSADPLHKHILQPANFEHGCQLDVVENGTKYFDELAVLLVEHFTIEMQIPRPLEWLSTRLKQFYKEMDHLEKTAKAEPFKPN